MLKLALTLIFVLSANFVQAQECATNVNELQDITRDPHLNLRWIETTEKDSSRVLTLVVGNAGSIGMGLRLTLPNGTLWADFKGKICKSSDTAYYAVVNKGASSWGPGAPSLVKLFGKPSRVNLNLNSSTQLKVQASKYKGTYRPL